MQGAQEAARPARWWCLWLCLVLGAVVFGPAAHAQDPSRIQSNILTIESDRLFVDSAFGRRVAQEIETASNTLAAENRRIEADLTAEEKVLSDQRAEMDPEAFRALADEFDRRVQSIRRTQDGKARSLNQKTEADRRLFLQLAAPILEQLMRAANAAVILERSSVFLSANTSDITDRAIRAIDAAIGDGVSLPERE